MNIVVLFILLSVINVIFSTIRSILTIKGGKTIASIISGGYFAFYNIMLIYTVADFPMWEKCIITFACNVVGVFLVKYMEEKLQKDKLWNVKVTIPATHMAEMKGLLRETNIPYSYIDIEKYFIFDCYCETQKQTTAVLKMCEVFHGKAFATENKLI